MSELNIGDKVEIVNYGHIIRGKYVMVNGNYEFLDEVWDMLPHLVGKTGIIHEIDHGSYSLRDMDGHKTAWYDAEQLKKIE